MSLAVTDAIVLHAFNYLESSRVLRLATREHGVQSVLAKGARRSRKRFGSAVDLFAEGQAHYYAKSGRDLHTLASFDVVRARLALGEDLERFSAAAAVSELVLRFAREETQPAWYATLVDTLDALAIAPAASARTAGLAGTWRLIVALGFAPSMDHCASCHDLIAVDRPARFSHPAGGVLCDRCGRLTGVGRVLPAEALAALRAWTSDGSASESGGDGIALDDASARAHQRLLREFLREHLTDGRPLRAFESWEGARWGTADATPAAEGAR